MPPPWLHALNSSPPYDRYALAQHRIREIRSSFGSDPEFIRFAHAAQRWLSDWEHCGAMRAAADSVVRGGVGNPDAEIALQTIGQADPVAPPLFRGFALPLHEWEILAEYPAGTCFDLPLVSFTSDFLQACEFAWLARGDD